MTTARVICLGCAALARVRDRDPRTLYWWALQCVCGLITPGDLRALRADINAADEREAQARGEP